MNKHITAAVCTAILIKSIFFVFFAYQFKTYYPSQNIVNHIFISAGDTYSYFPPIESLIEGNGYYIKDEIKGFSYRPNAERMPGLLPIYGPLYYVFGSDTAKFLFILFQFCMSTIAMVLFAYLAFDLFNSWSVFYFVLFIYAFSINILVLDHWGLSDSLSISFSIVGLYFFVKAIRVITREKYKSVTKVNVLFLISGIFICWATFIRPVYGIFFSWLIIIYLVLVFPTDKKSLVNSFCRLSIYALPLIVCLGVWTTRNYIVFNKIIPLQMPYENIFPKQTHLLMSAMAMTGNDMQPWIQGSVGQWFYPYFLENKYHYSKDPFTQHPFTSKDFTPDFTLDSLILLRERYHNSFKPQFTEKERINFANQSINSINFYINSFKEHYPLRYYLLSSVEITLELLFVKRLSNLPFPEFSEMKLYQKIIKGLCIVYYNAIVFIGMLGFLLTIRNKKWLAILFSLSVVPYIGLITFYYQTTEHRYFATAYPFFVLFAAYAMAYIYQMIQNKKLATKLSQVKYPNTNR